MYAVIHTHTFASAYTHTYVHVHNTHMHVHLHAWHTPTHSQRETYTQKHTKQKHTHKQTYTQNHTHMHKTNRNWTYFAACSPGFPAAWVWNNKEKFDECFPLNNTSHSGSQIKLFFNNCPLYALPACNECWHSPLNRCQDWLTLTYLLFYLTGACCFIYQCRTEHKPFQNMSALQVHNFSRHLKKCTMKTSRSCRITCEHSESAHERIALHKINQQQQIKLLQQFLFIIIMYIYHALINALSTHMIHINLNMIFYTHVEQSYQNNLHKVLYKKRTTNAHTDCSRNWVVILVRMEILWEEEGFQFGFKRRQG